jgi:hypothetical protein
MADIPATYYVIEDHGRLGRETVIDWEHCSKANIIDRLIAGEYTRPIEVHCIDRELGQWSDVSQDIAQVIVEQLQEEPKGALFDFLEEALGMRLMAELGREAWGAHTQFGAGA